MLAYIKFTHANLARKGNSRLSRKAEECHHRPFDLDDLLRCQPANPDVDIRPLTVVSLSIITSLS